MPESATRAWAALMAVLLSAHNNTPHEIRVLVPSLVYFIAIDTITGLWLAGVKGQVRSRKMGQRLAAKLLQYASISGVGAVASMVASSWTPFHGTLLACMAIETISIFENLTLLERNGGANLGPVRPLLRNVAKYLDFSDPTTQPGGRRWSDDPSVAGAPTAEAVVVQQQPQAETSEAGDSKAPPSA